MLTVQAINSVRHDPRIINVQDRIVSEKEKQLGEAIRRIRRRKNMSQADVASRLGMEPPAFGRYEAGARKVILREDIQERIADALGVTREALQAEASAVADGREIWDLRRPPKTIIASGGIFSQGEQGFGVYEAEGGEDVDLSALLDGPVKALRVADDALSPYVEPGHFVIYHTSRMPRRYQAVVLKLRDGRLITRFYIRSTPAQIEVVRHEGMSSDQGRAYREVSEFINVSDVSGVYPVILRGD